MAWAAAEFRIQYGKCAIDHYTWDLMILNSRKNLFKEASVRDGKGADGRRQCQAPERSAALNSPARGTRETPIIEQGPSLTNITRQQKRLQSL